MSALTKILCGDALEKLRELPDESVQCCVTSPPFWGLRDYGTAKWESEPDGQNCDHVGPPMRTNNKPSDPNATFHGGATRGTEPWKNGTCGKCGAKRIDAQIGLEKTPEEYVAKMVAVFREVRRVLRKDGTLWLNLGDSYAQGNKGNSGALTGPNGATCKQATNVGSLDTRHGEKLGPNRNGGTKGFCKPKDLVGIPWMVAFALRADGWWLRSDIIWAKPNPMPEPVSDRPTKSHEYIFLLTKSARYFYDADAIKERASPSLLQQIEQGYNGNSTKDFFDAGAQDASGTKHRIIEGFRAKVRKPAGWATHNGSHGSIHRDGREQEISYGQIELKVNKRSVWTVTTQPYREAHFATYPPDLIKPCILAGSRVGDIVLDPFAGSGTTGQVALELGRRAILIDLNPKYIPLIHQRTNITPGLALAV